MAFNIDQYMLDFIAGSSVEMFVNGSPAFSGQVITNGQLVELKAGAGFKFESEPFFIYRDQFTWQDYIFTLPLDSTEKIGSALYTGIYDRRPGGSPSIATVIDESESGEVVPLNNVYVVDADIIESVNEQRFIIRYDGDVEDNIDYGVYILSLLKLPFKIDESLVVGENTVKLGHRTLTVSAPQVITDSIAVDMGSITVPEIEFNAIDFTNVAINLHLPFTNSITVESQYVIGETLGVEYIIDVYSGNAIINLTSTKVGGSVFFSVNVNLGVSVPYTTQSVSNQQLYNGNITQLGNNRITKPVIEVIKNDSILPYGFFTIPVTDEGSLIDETGFITVSNIELEVDAVNVERELIINKLSSGVIIK